MRLVLAFNEWLSYVCLTYLCWAARAALDVCGIP